MDRRKIFIDTSAWLAYFLSNELDHKTVKSLISMEINSGSLICTSNYVIDEAVTRLIYDTNWKNTSKFIEYIKEAVRLKTLVEFWVDEKVESESFSEFDKYHEHKLSFTDATTVVLLRHFNIKTVISLDKDFKKIGIGTLP